MRIEKRHTYADFLDIWKKIITRKIVCEAERASSSQSNSVEWHELRYNRYVCSHKSIEYTRNGKL